ncbi:hypothetical protein TKK_0013029 [Trichogramma kaykai]|uniref:Uncharacterized protein n=1 Tax=Trichogramma kaykai TaxID=54128 RepID=A0ABD2WIT9_9HYME
MGKARGVHETTPELRNRMVGMYEAGLKLKEIAAAINCSQRTVKRWLNRFNKEGNVETKDRCGRKRATTKEQDEAIVQLAMQTPLTAAKAVLPALGLNCSVDTVRERLHRAGIHNWNPPKKHIEKIPLNPSEGKELQQAVWRPTGTKVGKKKVDKVNKEISNVSEATEKSRSTKNSKSKESFEENSLSSEIIEPSDVHTNFLFGNKINDLQNEPAIQSHGIDMPPSSTSPLPLSTNLTQFSHSLSLLPQNHQPVYHHHPGLTHHWPIDSSAHNYTHSAFSSIHQEPLLPLITTNAQIHNQPDKPMTSLMHDPLHIPIHSNIVQQKSDFHPDLPDLSLDEHQQESQDIIINVCSDVCSEADSSSNENTQISSIGNELNNDIICDTSDNNQNTENVTKKKSGKAKGTLETSLEIRNRMIGMAEAGLSTLSIALAIHRSERTVKRWLDRWRKEGNVQTKERKGRKRITTKEEDEAIIAMATKQPLTAAKNVAPALGLKCSVDTVRERLHKAGIHSWKLEKKQGEGNSSHVVHLWQASGNRSGKIKSKLDKKKKSTRKKKNPNNNNNNSKQKVVEKVSEVLFPPHRSPPVQEMNLPTDNVNTSYPTQPHVPTPVHNLSSLNLNCDLVQPPLPPAPAPPPPPPPTYHHHHIHHHHHHQTPNSLFPQGPIAPPIGSLHHHHHHQPVAAAASMGALMQPRADCRFAFPPIIPHHHHHQPTTTTTYPSCMMSAAANGVGGSGIVPHTATAVEQSDVMNYEPYVWSF